MHNPYTVSTEITVDGQTPAPGTNYVQRTKGNRLSNWIDDFFRLVYDKYCKEDIFFEFRGIAQDAEDFQQALDRFNTSGKQKHRFQAEIKVSEIGNHPLEALTALYDEGKNGPYADLFNSERMEQAFERATSPEFEVNVIATMSSGKSTLLNALIGQNFIPSKQEACTATIARIEDCKEMKEFMAVRYDQDENCLNETPEPVSRKLLRDWNEDEKTSIIDIRGDIPTLDQTTDSKYVFVDTPGPNNSRNIKHREITYAAIKSKPLSMVLYVLDGGKYGINDDVKFLQEVAKAMGEGGRQAQDRFIFVQNKLDDVNLEEDSVEKMIDNAKKYLQENGIFNPTIIPVSARLAKLLRIRKFQGTLSIDDQAELDRLKGKFLRKGNEDLNLFEHAKKMVNPRIIQKIENRLQYASDDEKAEIYSGIPVLEELLNDFLCRHAIPAKTKDAVDSFSRILRDYEKAQCLNSILNQSDKEIQDTGNRLKGYFSSKDVLSKAEKFKKDINAITFSPSPHAQERINGIIKEEESILGYLRDRLLREGVDSKDEARRLCEKAEHECNDYEIEVRHVLEKTLDEECYYQIDQLRSQYQDYIIHKLGKAFPAGSAAGKLEDIILNIPEAEDLINRNSKTESVCVGSHKEVFWGSWLTFGLWRKTVNDYKNVTKVNMRPIYEEFVEGIRLFTRKNRKAFSDQAEKDLKASKTELLKIMDEALQKLTELGVTITNASKDLEAKKAQRRNIQDKIEWFKDFNDKLQKTVNI